MNDYFYLQFSSTEQIAHGFVQDSQNLSDVAQRLQRAVQGLYASGLQGAFVATFQSRMDSMQAMLRYFYEETDESGHDLLTVAQMARDLDATAARRFAEVGRYVWAGPVQDGALGGSGTPLYFAGGGGGGGGGGAWGYEPKRFDRGNLPNTLHQTQTEILRRYLGRELTYEEARRKIFAASEDQVWRNALDAKATFIEGDFFKYSDAAQSFSVSGDQWNANLDLLSYNAQGSYNLDFGAEGFEAGVSGEAGIYLIHGQVSAEANGFFATGDGFVGAVASGDADLKLDPRNGDLKASAEGELFAGAEVSGSVGYENDFFSVELQGTAAAGIGAKGKLEAGFEDGVFTFDAGGLVSAGAGGGGGLKVRVDVAEVGEFVVDQGTQGVKFLIGETIAWVDSLM